MLRPNLSDSIFESFDAPQRSSIVIRIIKASGMIILAGFLSTLLFKGLKNQPLPLIIFTAMLISLLVVVNSFSKIATRVIISINTQSIIIAYDTLWSEKGECVIPFANFSYDHFEKPSDAIARKNILAFYSHNKLIYTINDKEDGFDSEQLEALEETFRKFKFPKKESKNSV